MVRELTFPAAYAEARETLMRRCPAPKRSQIDDVLYRRPDGVLARLRRQDAVTRLGCTRPDIVSGAAETVVLDHAAARRLLDLLGFEAVDRIRLARETWRDCQYLLHLDRVEGQGDFLTVQDVQAAYPARIFRKMAVKRLNTLGITVGAADLDSPGSLAYTASIIPLR
jgi:adenylate cyclase class IV